ncbi:hypothetical protein HXX76_001044 [Chlamydomonas incerta]|uniref:lipoyl(octanoyl) transferase n=1 Tax=Chlamydomonas incerta TaxID=51695 RepID=A0A835WBE6_CHLIN|nr:hypothetical protein HXX76_001044 [Chlamydomonas incerta]|eukprot:KAG2444287.1 hypothetical protein HXX76_001044 [Chlamydomonas incerta]
MHVRRPLRVLNLAQSLTRYSEGLKLQDSIAADRKQGLVGDTLLLFQHYPVYTLGKRGRPEDFKKPREELEAAGVEVCVVPRGGEVTYHGPGQLVAYPIIGVREAGLGARAYVESLEDSVIDCLAGYGVAAQGRVPGATGVWVAERKVAAIGVRITYGVSSHGLALNVCPDLGAFDAIVPCGIPDKEVTSLQRELQRQLADSREQRRTQAAVAARLGAAAAASGAGAGAGAGEGGAAHAAAVAAAGGGEGGGPALFGAVVEDLVRAFCGRLGFEPRAA